MESAIWGIDLGGTKIEGIVLSGMATDKVLVRKRIATEAHRGYRHVVSRVVDLVELMKSEIGLKPSVIGFGTPGILDPQTQRMKNSNTTVLNGEPLKADLTEALGVPVILANDANCFALAETHLGVVRQSMEALPRTVFGVIMGTGVGGGIVVEGKVLNGRHGIAGEWGHNFLDKSGGPCYCGRTGCVETILSGPGLQRYYAQLSGEQRPLKEIIERHHRQPDDFTGQTMDRLIHFFGLALSVVVNILDPDVIVLGGGVGNVGELYTEGYRKLCEYTFHGNPRVQVVKPSLGDSAGVFGAAALAVPDKSISPWI